MRHFRLPGKIAALPLGMLVSSATAGLVTLAGFPHAALPRRLRTGSSAVAVASITVAAYHHGGAASRAQIASSRNFHGQLGPMGLDDNVRFVKYSACNVACWLRAWRWL